MLMSSSTFISSKSVLRRKPRSIFKTDPATSGGTAPRGVELRDTDEVVVGRALVEFGCVGGLAVDGLGVSKRLASL